MDSKQIEKEKEERKERGRKLGIVLILVIVAFILGSALREMTDYKEAGVGAAIGLPALIALFGMFWVAANWKDALTAAFAVTYFIFVAGILAIFVFPAQNLPLEGGAKVVVDNFTSLVAIVMAAYFGQEAVRAAAQAYSDGKMMEAKGKGGPDETNKGDDEAKATTGQGLLPMQIDTQATPR